MSAGTPFDQTLNSQSVAGVVASGDSSQGTVRAEPARLIGIAEFCQ